MDWLPSAAAWSARLMVIAFFVLPSLAVAQPFGLTNRLANTTLAFPQQLPVYGFLVTNAFGANLFSQPLCIRTAPGDTNRVFVVQKGGQIRVVTNLSAANPANLLYMNVSFALATTSEMGLLGLAFHPNFQTNGFLFTYRSIRITNGATSVINERLSRFTASPPSAGTVNTNTEIVLFEQVDPAGNHNGGDLHFGPDGYLYISLGDGGDANDTFNNSQTIRRGFHAGILRLDVDSKPGGLPPNPPAPASGLSNLANYLVPPDNPWVTNVFLHETNRSATLTNNIRTEFWAVGLRNPWRMSFDFNTGWLWCGDVGQGAREEVDIITGGGNYGWGYREGLNSGPKATQTNDWYNASTPAPFATTFSSVKPIYDYGRGASGTNVGNSVTGGIVYSGNNISQLTGAYVFADYGSQSPGNVWSLRYDGTSISQFQQLLALPGFVGFGTDPRNGDVLIANINDGVIYRLLYDLNNVAGTPLPSTLAATGAFTNVATLTPHAGLVPYDVNVPHWADNGIASRWFSLPNTNLTFTYHATTNWSSPTGSVWVQHFDLVTNHLTQARTRVETRFLVRNPGGAYGVSYQWAGNPANATLVGDGGTNELFVITDPGGTLRTQRWIFPARSECLNCHTAAGGRAPGFHTAQLNRELAYTNFANATGVTDNQVRALNHAGYLSPAPDDLFTLPALAPVANSAVSLEWRVRSFLAANCAQCHQPGGPATANFDVRHHVPTALAGLVNGAVVNHFGNPNAFVIAPGSLTNSLLYQRLGAFTSTRMPGVGTLLPDTNNLNLVAAWIGSAALAGYQEFAPWQLVNFGSTNAPNALPDADPDGDSLSNDLEWLLGTNPNEAASDWKVSIQMNGPNAQIVFPQIANRGFEVQLRTPLEEPPLWTPLQVPGNAPFFSKTTFTNVVEDTNGSASNKTYRVRVFAP